MSPNKTLSLLVVSAVLIGAQAVVAHDPESNPGKAQHGGQYVEYQQHHGIELIAQKNKLIFHMTEHLQPADMTGSAFRIYVQTDERTQKLPAKPDGPKLVAAIEGPLPTGSRVVLTGRDSGDRIIQARFVTR